MAETIISPGVFTRENDISFIQPAPVAAGAAIIGPTVKGPVEVPTLVTSYNDYVRKFGITFASGSSSYEFLTSLAVKNYFQQGGNSVLVSRVVSGSNNWTRAVSTDINNTTTTTGLTFASGSGTLAATAADGQEYQIQGGGETYNFTAISGSLPDDIPSANQYYFDPGSSAEATVDNLGAKINSIAGFPVDADLTSGGVDLFILSGSAVGTTYNGYIFSTGSAAGGDPDFTLFTLEGGTNTTTATTNSFLLETLGKGEIYNNATGSADTGGQNSDGSLVSGSADNLRWEISNVNNDLGTFTVAVRRGADNFKNKVVLETFNDCSLDPNSPNYIEKVIGNQYQVLNPSENYIQTVGEFVNNSNYVRVSQVNTATIDYLGTDGLTVNTDNENVSYSASLPVASSGSFHSAVGSLYHFTEDNLFFDNIATGQNTQGLEAGDYANTIAVLENTEEYSFNIISAPGLVYSFAEHGTQLDGIISLAETRGDCIAVVDLVDYGSTVTNTTGQAGLLNSSYAASYWPWLQMQSATGKNEWVPASVAIPGVYAFTDNSSAPWFAPAGLVRGGITGVIQAERRLTRTQRDSLYSKKVNPIASFPGQGISVFGQKTLQTKASALDRVNVRRLLIELKKFIGDQARNLVFEQNTIATRNRFLATVNPYLESVVQRQGLYAYRVVMDDTNNTADVVDRNQLIGQIFIQPAKTAEFIVLDFTIEPTGATFED
jgi:phage tail sheath protein FI